MRLQLSFFGALAIALTPITPAIAAPLAEITLDTARQNAAITAGGVRVVVTEFAPYNYEADEATYLSYEIYVDGDLKTQVREAVDFMTGSLTLDQLDPDGVPEVIFQRFTGGAHCCIIYRVYSWQGDRLHRLQTYPLDAAAAGNFEDLNADGYSELVSADHRFLYAFGSYASSWPPTVILTFRGGTLIDVTRQFADRLRSQLSAVSEYTQDSAPNEPVPEANSILAGYVAQTILLGEYESGWDYMLTHHDPTDPWGLEIYSPFGDLVGTYPDYPTALETFLIDLAYLTPDGIPNPNLDLSKAIVEIESLL